MSSRRNKSKKKPRLSKRKIKHSYPKREPGIDLLDNVEHDAELIDKEFDGMASYEFHNDERPTVILIAGKIFELVPAKVTFKELLKTEAKDRPHVRHLSPIPLRTREQQETYNDDCQSLSAINKKYANGRDSGKITSLNKAVKMGADVPKEVERLIMEKNNTEDPKELSKIRKQLRKLDYKRYATEEE